MKDKVLTPKLTKPARKDKSLLIRMAADERAIFDERFKKSGYKSAGGFVRDYIINSKPKRRYVIVPQAQKANEHLVELAQMILDGEEKELLIRKIMHVAVNIFGELEGIDLAGKGEEGESYDW
ncbi:hypothetical protein [Pseudomonas putida]|uniref:hypothetical protein n=1 Tax=Pseudomonas putida TaxID=303 RepID=UPI001E3596EC|nr:hypothetical protein [Pseudomonas putida]ELU0814350.1 hypothetical protein [Pseudomonas putida]MCE0883453.1 hypothetical protein [Pseudomonas putida]MDD1990126.1 hypothetical protein [Pseudomonas putida]HDS1794469.1 hypothetical protein [Pseudomonas putida]